MFLLKCVLETLSSVLFPAGGETVFSAMPDVPVIETHREMACPHVWQPVLLSPFP